MEQTWYFRINDRSLLKVIVKHYKDNREPQRRIVLIDTKKMVKDTVLYDPNKNNIENINDSLSTISDLAIKGTYGDEKDKYLQNTFKDINKLGVDVHKFVTQTLPLNFYNQSQILVDYKHMLSISKKLDDGKEYMEVKVKDIPLLGTTLSTRYAQVILTKDFDIFDEVMNTTITKMVADLYNNDFKKHQGILNSLLVKLRDKTFADEYFNMFLSVWRMSTNQGVEHIENMSCNQDDDEKVKLAKCLNTLGDLSFIDDITIHFKHGGNDND